MASAKCKIDHVWHAENFVLAQSVVLNLAQLIGRLEGKAQKLAEGLHENASKLEGLIFEEIRGR